MLGVTCLVGLASAEAASPGVPLVESTAADYVGYAEGDALPAWFRNAAVANTDNTPVDNQLTNAGAELGRVLFYDQRLSHNNTKSCASCHVQETGFGDPAQFSEGFVGGQTGRHSMALSNARYYANGAFFWDERAASLEDQVLMPIEDGVEMGSDIDNQLLGELADTDYYPVLFQRAFGSSEVTREGMQKALAQFVRAMVSYDSEFDQAAAAGTVATPNFAAVDSIEDPAAAARGHATFRANCAACHRTNAHVSADTFNIGLDATNTDEGAGDGEFKAPSLRNAAERGRFMHDGRFASLEEVVEFYAEGVQANPDLSLGLRPGGFRFTDAQQADLVAFLETLSDETFLTSELFSNPFLDLPGDYDGDGVVDASDYDAWLVAYGTEEAADPLGGPLYADGNGDGVVNLADYTLWRDNFGARWDANWVTEFAAAVPEPGSLALVGFAVLAAARRRRRHSPNSST